MIASLAKVKAILGITDTAQDTRINALIPLVENDIVEYCNNSFRNPNIYYSGSITIGATGSTYSLTCADGGMDDLSWVANDYIDIEGSTRNDGFKTIATIADTVITTAEPLIAETAKAITIWLVQFPAGLELYFARMIGYLLKHGDDAGITSESIGSYSYSRNGTGSSAGYPDEILKGLNRWQYLSVGRGRRVAHVYDARGTYIPDEID